MGGNNPVYLFCFPLDIVSKIKTHSGLICFHLIWLKCCYTHGFSELTISKKDRERIHFPRISYERGLKDLERKGVIMVDRKKGRLCRIFVNVELLDSKSKDFILKGSGAA